MVGNVLLLEHVNDCSISVVIAVTMPYRLCLHNRSTLLHCLHTSSIAVDILLTASSRVVSGRSVGKRPEQKVGAYTILLIR